MATLSNNVITMCRGDYFKIDLTVENADGSIHDLQTGEKVEFILREKPSRLPSNKVILKKTFTNRVVEFNSSDTTYLTGGKYYYDIIFTYASGNTDTIAKGKFFIKL